MPRKIPSLCVALLLTLCSAYAARRTLNSISELHTCVPQPTNILELLRWFANTVNIDDYGNMWVTFDPNSDYGSHHYGNYEGLLDQAPRCYKYYTVGNVQKDIGQLPSSVIDARRGSVGWNRARIIFSSTEANGRWNIRQVYITQHYGTSVYNGTSYDPQHTYEITTNLLQEFRGRSKLKIQHDAINYKRNFGNISTHPKEFSFSNQYNYVLQPNPRTNDDEDDVLGKFCIALALFFIVLLFFAANASK